MLYVNVYQRGGDQFVGNAHSDRHAAQHELYYEHKTRRVGLLLVSIKGAP